MPQGRKSKEVVYDAGRRSGSKRGSKRRSKEGRGSKTDYSKLRFSETTRMKREEAAKKLQQGFRGRDPNRAMSPRAAGRPPTPTSPGCLESNFHLRK